MKGLIQMIKLKQLLEVCNPDWLQIGGRCLDVNRIGGVPKKLGDVSVKEVTGWDDGLTVELMTGLTPCESLPVGDYRRAREAIKIVYNYSAVGSGLHIVLDDENVEDSHIRWCLENSIPEIKNALERCACEMCAELLLRLPLSAREQLIHSYGREWW